MFGSRLKRKLPDPGGAIICTSTCLLVPSALTPPPCNMLFVHFVPSAARCVPVCAALCFPAILFNSKMWAIHFNKTLDFGCQCRVPNTRARGTQGLVGMRRPSLTLEFGAVTCTTGPSIHIQNRRRHFMNNVYICTYDIQPCIIFHLVT